MVAAIEQARGTFPDLEKIPKEEEETEDEICRVTS